MTNIDTENTLEDYVKNEIFNFSKYEITTILKEYNNIIIPYINNKINIHKGISEINKKIILKDFYYNILPNIINNYKNN
jgi:hypothetical protein